jgi:hypothetical protein
LRTDIVWKFHHTIPFGNPEFVKLS